MSPAHKPGRVVAKLGDAERRERGSPCTEVFSRVWFLVTCEFGVWAKLQAVVPILSGIQGQSLTPGLGEVACLGLPERLLGNAHTQLGWPTRYRSTLSVQEASGFGYSSAIELKSVCFPSTRDFHIS